MPIMIGNRDDLVRTTTGHSVGFKTGEERFVPNIPALVKACVERGHVVKKEVKAAPAAAPAQAVSKSQPSGK